MFCEDKEGIGIQYLSKGENARKVELATKVLLTIPVVYLLLKFFMVDFWNLAQLSIKLVITI